MNCDRITVGRRPGTYTNALLTLIALLLGVALMQRAGPEEAGAGPGAAMAALEPPAGPGRGTGLISAADQRKIMISEIRRIGSRLERIESALSRGISVRVTELPRAAPEGK